MTEVNALTKATQLDRRFLQLPLASVVRMTPVEKLNWPAIERFGVEVWCKRDELLHPHLSGNKFYKLHGHIQSFYATGSDCIVSFGGAFSNHLVALAAAGQMLSLPTVGFVRGEPPASAGATLRDLECFGMRLIFVSRQEYRHRANSQWVAEQCAKFDITNPYVIPEGGGGLHGAMGCVTWAQQTMAMMSPQYPDVVCVAAGTGVSAAGLSVGLGGVPLHVVLSLRGKQIETQQFATNLETLQQALLEQDDVGLGGSSEMILETDYHCGGYAKFPDTLRHFVSEFEEQTGMLLDPVYTAKLFWAIWQKVSAGEWSSVGRVLAFHSGGLQGRRGMLMP